MISTTVRGVWLAQLPRDAVVAHHNRHDVAVGIPIAPPKAAVGESLAGRIGGAPGEDAPLVGGRRGSRPSGRPPRCCARAARAVRPGRKMPGHRWLGGRRNRETGRGLAAAGRPAPTCLDGRTAGTTGLSGSAHLFAFRPSPRRPARVLSAPRGCDNDEEPPLWLEKRPRIVADAPAAGRAPSSGAGSTIDADAEPNSRLVRPPRVIIQPRAVPVTSPGACPGGALQRWR
jgi:hypothetical protein